MSKLLSCSGEFEKKPRRVRTPDSRSTLCGDHEAATVSTDHFVLDAETHDARDRRVSYQKSPLVQGDHRRAFLDLLECRYGRRFGNPWAFVEYAQAENLGLDFIIRFKRPDPKAILQNIRTLLDAAKSPSSLRVLSLSQENA